MSRTFSMTSGSSEILKDATTCGCNPKVRQDAAHGGGTDASALRHLAGAPVGPPLRLTFQRGRRGSTRHPHRTVSGGLRAWARHTAQSTRPVVTRCRHLPTGTFEQRSFAATATFDSPCAHLRTIFARKATCRFVLARLASRSSSPRSTAVTSNLALGRPVLAMPPHTSHPAHFLKLFQTQGTRTRRVFIGEDGPAQVLTSCADRAIR